MSLLLLFHPCPYRQLDKWSSFISAERCPRGIWYSSFWLSRHITYINYFRFWHVSLLCMTPRSPRLEGLSSILRSTFHVTAAHGRWYYKCGYHQMEGLGKGNSELYSQFCRSRRKISLTSKWKILFYWTKDSLPFMWCVVTFIFSLEDHMNMEYCFTGWKFAIFLFSQITYIYSLRHETQE
jgi:hypothetical protein